MCIYLNALHSCMLLVVVLCWIVVLVCLLVECFPDVFFGLKYVDVFLGCKFFKFSVHFPSCWFLVEVFLVCLKSNLALRCVVPLDYLGFLVPCSTEASQVRYY